MQVEAARFYLERDGELYQAVHVTGLDAEVDAFHVASGDDVAFQETAQPLAFEGGWLVPVPEVGAPTEMRVRAGNNNTATVTVTPEPKWTVHITPHTHLDIGFTEHQSEVWERLFHNLRNVIRMCEETRDFPEAAQYKWTIEQSALLENFVERASAEEIDTLRQLMREGRVELAGLYVNLLTELASPEVLCRSLYPAARYRRQWDIPVNTAFINDIPGYTWGLPGLLRSAGIDFLNLRANGVRAKFIWSREGAVERPFWWEGPDGSRILTWYTDSYREANALRGGYDENLWERIAEAPGNLAGYGSVLAYLDRVESVGYPLDMVQMRMGGDNIEATVTPCYYVRDWNERIAYPRLVMGTNREFYEALKPHGDELPVHRGDIPDWWADGAASSARETGEARVLQDRLAQLETAASMADWLGGEEWDYPREAIDSAYKHLLLYEEHTWGSHYSQRGTEQAERQWETKAGYVTQAREDVEAVEAEVRSRLERAVPSAESVEMFVNTHSWPVMRDGKVVPPLGYGTIGKDHGPDSLEKSLPRRSEALEAVLGEIATATDIQRFGTYIYETGGEREKIFPVRDGVPELEKTYSQAAEQYGRRGYIKGGFGYDLHLEAAGVESLKQHLHAYPEKDRLEVTIQMDKTDTHDPEGVYFEFPFDLDGYTPYVDLPLAWMRPEQDQLPYSARDFYSVYQWVALSDGNRTVTIVPVEAPLVMFGKIRSDQWLDHLEYGESTVYSYAMNNYWFTNYRFHQGGPHQFRYTVQVTDGPFDPVAAERLGREVMTPPFRVEVAGDGAETSESRSLLKVEPASVMLLNAKRAEDGRGHIARLHEVSGEAVTARLAFEEGLEFEVYRTSVTEEDMKPLEMDGNTLEIPLRGFEMVALRLIRQ